MKKIIYKHYFRCGYQGGDTLITDAFEDWVNIGVNQYSFNGLSNGDGTYSAPPAWFTQVTDSPAYPPFWFFSYPDESNTDYQFSWTANNVNGTQTEYIVRLTMLDYCYTAIGCKSGTNKKPLSVLLFLTREGGWMYFPFNGRKTLEVAIPDSNKYMSTNYILRNTDRIGVYEGETLTTGDIPVEALDLLASLKKSIQVYFVEFFQSTTEQPKYIPVVLLDGDFVKRKTGDKRFDVQVKFIYAEQQKIQTQ